SSSEYLFLILILTKRIRKSLIKIINMKLIAKATIQIQKPIEEVYEGIVDPTKIKKYFISESNGRLEPEKELIWKFPEFPDECPIKGVKVEINRLISFVWDPETVITIVLEAQPDNSTLVKVTE